MGRTDNQIKFMGHRIELEEIEAVSNSLEVVVQCACVFLKKEIGGTICLALEVSSPSTVKQLHSWLQRLLPYYMLPKEIKILDQLPKNRNGKVDRNSVRTLFEK